MSDLTIDDIERFATEYPSRCEWAEEDGERVLYVDGWEAARIAEGVADAVDHRLGDYMLDPDEGFQDEDDGDPNQRLLF